MAAFDSAEIVRQPLDALILRLRTMLGAETAVVPVLQDVIEPPSIENIDSSFRSERVHVTLQNKILEYSSIAGTLAKRR